MGKQGHLAIGKDFDLTDDAVASMESASSAACRSKRVGTDAQRICIFQSLCGSVQRVSHVSVHAGDTVLCWARAHASSDRFVIGEGLACESIDAANGQIVHGS